MGISVGPLLLIFLIAILLFGTNKLKNLGGDLGGALRDFKQSLGDDIKIEEKSKPVEQITTKKDN